MDSTDHRRRILTDAVTTGLPRATMESDKDTKRDQADRKSTEGTG
jgi:hypothetical protein